MESLRCIVNVLGREPRVSYPFSRGTKSEIATVHDVANILIICPLQISAVTFVREKAR